MELFVAGCSVAWSTRSTSSYLIDKHILFDCGEATFKNIIKFYGEEVINNIDCIFITHFHADHFFGITPYIAKLTNRGIVPNKKLTIVGGSGLRKILEFIIPTSITTHEINIDDYLNIIEVDDFDTEIKVCEYVVKPFKLSHGNTEDIGYAIKTHNGVLGYTGDTIFDDNLIKFASNCDALICDVSSVENSATHNGVEGYFKLEKLYPSLDLFAVHCSEKVFSNADNLGINVLKEMNEYSFENRGLKCKL